MERKAKIYALVNPLNSNVFYIGVTLAGLNIRLSQHVSTRNTSTNSPKCELLRNLYAQGVIPEIIGLDEVDFNQATFWESFYIDLFSFYGFDLLQRRTSTYNRVHAVGVVNTHQRKKVAINIEDKTFKKLKSMLTYDCRSFNGLVVRSLAEHIQSQSLK